MKNNIAEVAVSISFALNEQFDYLIPPELETSLVIGSRVLVPFRTNKVVGYVLKLKSHSIFKDRLKLIDKNLDSRPLLDPFLFKMAHKIQSEYFCSLSEAISTVIPCGNKRFKSIDLERGTSPLAINALNFSEQEQKNLKLKELLASIVLIHDLSNERRWSVYSSLIKKALNEKRGLKAHSGELRPLGLSGV